MHLFHAPFRTEIYTFLALNRALWDMEQVHSGISKLGQFIYVPDVKFECMSVQIKQKTNINKQIPGPPCQCRYHKYIVLELRMNTSRLCFHDGHNKYIQ